MKGKNLSAFVNIEAELGWGGGSGLSGKTEASYATNRTGKNNSLTLLK